MPPRFPQASFVCLAWEGRKPLNAEFGMANADFKERVFIPHSELRIPHLNQSSFGFFTSPRRSLIFSSMAWAISGCSFKKTLAFSRP